MCEVQVRIHRTVLVQPKVLVRWWEALQKVCGDKLVKFCETGLEEWILVACDDRRRSKVAANIVVRHPAKQHDRLDEQQKGVGVFRWMVDEQVLVGHVLGIDRDASL